MSGPFKAGDLIECIDARPPPRRPDILRTGELYTIRRAGFDRKGRPCIEIDKVPLCHNGKSWRFPPDRFRLVRRPGDHADFLASLTKGMGDAVRPVAKPPARVKVTVDTD